MADGAGPSHREVAIFPPASPLVTCCAVPEVRPADVAQRLHVLLSDAACVSWQTLSVHLLLSPLALWEHTWRAQENKPTHPPSPSVLHVIKNTCCAEEREGRTQYPSSPAGRRGLTAAVHGRASPAAGTGWPTGLMVPQLKTPTGSKHGFGLLLPAPWPSTELPHLLHSPHS